MEGNDGEIQSKTAKHIIRADDLENRDRVPEYERSKEVEGIGTLDPILFPSRSAARDSYLFSLRRARLLEEGWGGGGGVSYGTTCTWGVERTTYGEHRVPHTLCASDCTASTTPGAPIGSP